jgi:hypothetical protein
VKKKYFKLSGNLTLHLFGDVNTNIGKEIGKLIMLEIENLNFLKKYSRTGKIKNLKDTINVVRNSLLEFPVHELEDEYQF